jgi:hypothetical protein
MEIEDKSVSDWKFFFICLVIVMAVYLPVNYFGAVNMDDTEIFTRFSTHDKPPDFFSMFMRPAASRYYRPLLAISFYLDSLVWGHSIKGYHLTNYLVHVLNAVLVFLLVLKLAAAARDKFLYAGVAMLMAGLHPLTCESVAWISGRSDIAGTLFVLAGANFYFMKSRLRFVLVPLAVFAGMLCKENALAGMLVIVLMDIYVNYSRKERWPMVLEKAAVWACLMAIVCVLYLSLRTNGWHVHSHTGLLPHLKSGTAAGGHEKYLRFFQVFPAIGFYMKKLVVPFPLNFAISHIDTQIYSIVFFLLLLFNVICWFKGKKYAVFITLVMIISFFPALPVIFGAVSWVPFAERYLYLSVHVGAVCLAAICQAKFHDLSFSAVKIRNAVFAFIIAISAFTTLNREFVWKDSRTLWSDTLKKNPCSSMVLFKYGQAFGKDTGFRAWKRAIALSGDFKYMDLTCLGIAEYEARAHHYEKAGEFIEKALKTRKTYKNLCRAAEIIQSFEIPDYEQKQLWIKKAIRYYSTAYKKKKNAFILFETAKLMKQAGMNSGAVAVLKKLITEYPDSKYAVYAARLLERRGKSVSPG